MTTTTSSAFVPSDPEAIYRRLRSIMVSSEDPYIKAAWATALKNSTAERLLRTFVRAVEQAQYSIGRATEERHLDTALLESSIRAILRDMDVRTMRNIPAGLNVYVSRSSDTSITEVIPAFSQFTGGGKTFYTRYPITFGVGERVVQARFYIGTVKNDSFVSDGSDFKVWLSPDGDFTVSDGRESYKGVEYSDILVRVAGTPVRVTEYDQWWDMIKDSDKAVKDGTTADGRCQLTFGDGSYGYKPPQNALVQIQYIVTNGSSDNSGTFQSNLVMLGNTNMTAYPVTTGSGTVQATAKVDGGADKVAASTYRKTGPLLYASAGNAVRRKSSQAWAINYPGVADALVLGQSKTNPNDRRYLNVLEVCILKGGEGIDPEDYKMSAAEASGWMAHFNKRRPNVPGLMVFREPIPSSPDIELVLECENYVTLALAESAALQAIQDLYQYGPGTLRRTITQSELFDVAKYSTQGIRIVRMNGVGTDLVTYARAPALSLYGESESGAKLSAGDYVFYVLSVCDVYEGSTAITELSAPSNALVYNATGAANPVISFTPQVGAKAYRVYCRKPNSDTYNQIAELDSRTYKLDIKPDMNFSGAEMPTSKPTAFRFPKLGNLKISAVYVSSEW